MNKGRWAQLSGIQTEKPILMLEGNVPFYKEDLVDLVKEEIAKAMRESQTQKDLSDIQLGKSSRSVTTTMGFPGVGFARNKDANQKNISRGPGRTFGFGGPGFM